MERESRKERKHSRSRSPRNDDKKDRDLRRSTRSPSSASSSPPTKTKTVETIDLSKSPPARKDRSSDREKEKDKHGDRDRSRRRERPKSTDDNREKRHSKKSKKRSKRDPDDIESRKQEKKEKKEEKEKEKDERTEQRLERDRRADREERRAERQERHERQDRQERQERASRGDREQQRTYRGRGSDFPDRYDHRDRERYYVAPHHADRRNSDHYRGHNDGNTYNRRRGGERDRRRRSRSLSLAPPEVAATDEPNAWRKKGAIRHDWRKEQQRNDRNKDKDSKDESGDEDDEEKILEAARLRREAIKAKYAAAETKSPEPEAGATPEKNLDSESESGTGTSLGSELQHRLKTDASGIKDLNRYIREQKEQFSEEKAKRKQKEEGGGEEKSKSSSGDKGEKTAERIVKEEENMFGEFDTNKRTRGEGMGMTGASAHDWDDQDGYYKPQLNEVMDERYQVFADCCGKGVFSNVVKAKDKKHKGVDVAIKVIRNNDMMRRAAEKEVAILRLLNSHDKGDKRFVVRLLRTFDYRDHLCMVFECMWDNARTAIKKLGRPGRGVSLNLVHAWTRQLFIALRLLQKCNIIHADLKPDNLLVGGSGKTPILKICDIGSAFDASENEVTPYVVSRFYRAPEIILGLRYTTSIDVWAAAVTIFELFTSKILFKGATNNEMLKKISEIRGKMLTKVLRNAQFAKNHYNENNDFVFEDKDPATGKQVSRVITDFPNAKPTAVTDMLLEYIPKGRLRSEDLYDETYVKLVKTMGDFLTRCLSLDYEKRMTPDEALQHVFPKSPFPDAMKLRGKKNR